MLHSNREKNAHRRRKNEIIEGKSTKIFYKNIYA